MKIGIVIREPGFQESGGGSFVKSILNEARQTLKEKKYDYVFCYRGKATDRWKKVRGGITYINITAFNIIHMHSIICEGLRNAARNCKRRFQQKRPVRSNVSFWDILAQKEHIDLYWFTFPEDEVVSTPYIYTLWDLGHRMLPMLPEVSSSVYEWESREQMYKRTIYRASYILTGNETGKNEIVQNYAVSEEKVRIVPFPISDFCYGEEEKPDMELPDQFFFYPVIVLFAADRHKGDPFSRFTFFILFAQKLRIFKKADRLFVLQDRKRWMLLIKSYSLDLSAMGRLSIYTNTHMG